MRFINICPEKPICLKCTDTDLMLVAFFTVAKIDVHLFLCTKYLVQS